LPAVKTLALLVMLLMPIAVANARDAASVRVGDHASFIRVVLETAHRVQTTIILNPDGLSATITAAADLDIALPSRMTGVITAIDKATPQDTASSVTLHFRAAVKLASQSTLPPEAALGQRFVLDFQPLVSGAPSATDAAPPAPPIPAPKPKTLAAKPPAADQPTPEIPKPKNGDFVLTGFRSAAFGFSLESVLLAIDADFGHEIRTGATHSGSAGKHMLTLVSSPLLPNTTPPTIVYTIEPQPRGLSLVQLTWNGLGGAGLTEADAIKITEPMTGVFKSVAFVGGHTVIGLAMPDGQLVVFQGTDAAGNSVRMIMRPATGNGTGIGTGGEGDKRYVIDLTYTEGPTPQSK
jgi:hypothetical protein